MKQKMAGYLCQVINRWTIIFVTFLSGWAHNLHAQKERLPLKAVLKSIEGRFEVVFSYADENIAEQALTAPDEHLTLSQTLEYLSRETGYVFTPLDDRFIAIQKQEEHILQVCGYLQDLETGEPIASATVTAGEDFTVSDESGYFEVSVLASDAGAISILHLGYNPLRTAVAPSECKTYALTPSVSELQEVYISNYLVIGIDKKAGGELAVRTQSLQVLPGMSEPDVLQTMQVLPGVGSVDESVSNINIRGGTHDQNLILWEGIRMYQTGHFLGLISAFNPYFSDRVTLVKNGTSARFGNGVSGTLSMESNDDVPDAPHGGAGLNLLSGDAYVDLPLSKKVSLRLSGRRSLADLWKTPTYRSYFDRAFRNTDLTEVSSADSLIRNDERFYFYDLSSRLNFNISESSRLSVSFLRVANELAYKENEVLDGKLEARESGLSQNSVASGLSYRHKRDIMEVNFSGYVSSYKLSALNNDILDDQQLIQENHVLDLSAAMASKITFNPRLNLLGGASFNEIGMSNLEDLNNPDFSRRIKDVIRSGYFYTEASYTSPSLLTYVRPGIRASYYQQLDEVLLEPRLAVRQQLTGALSLELLAELKNQVTTQVIDLQNDFLGMVKERWVLSNGSDIPLIKSKQVSAGLHYDKNELLISLECYIKQVHGIITSSQSFQNQFEFVRSAGRYHSRGLELLAKKSLNGFSGWLSYSLAECRYQFGELIPPGFPSNLDLRHDARLGASYRSALFQVSSSLSWHSGYPFTQPDADTPLSSGTINYQEPNSSRIENYLRLDLSAKRTFSLGEKTAGHLGFSIWNMTNRENILGNYYRVADNEVKSVFQKGLFFTPNISMRVSF